MLDKARSLNRTDRWKNVYVTPDMTRKEQEIDYNLRKDLKERREIKGKKRRQKSGKTGYPGITTERKAPRTAEVPITRAAKQRQIQHRVMSKINVNNNSTQCNYVLKCYTFNARSLMNKINDLSVFMYENDPDVVFVTES